MTPNEEMKEYVLKLIDADAALHLKQHNPFGYKAEEHRSEFLKMWEGLNPLSMADQEVVIRAVRWYINETDDADIHLASAVKNMLDISEKETKTNP